MTGRSVPEWVGATADTKIPNRVRARVIARQNGRCACGCDVKLGLAGERIEFDHVVALILEGENREGNLQALRSPCHKTKTRADVAQKSKEARVRGKHMGFNDKRSTFRTNRDAPFKRKIGGGTVRRDQ